MQIGKCVIACAGKEKNQIFIVVGFDSKYVYLADGSRLKVSKPKKKSCKHIKAYGQETLTLSLDELKLERVNAKIRKFLKNKRSDYVEGRCN